MAEVSGVKIFTGSLAAATKSSSVHLNCLLVALFVFVWQLYFIKGDNGLDFIEFKYSAIVGSLWYPITFFAYVIFWAFRDFVKAKYLNKNSAPELKGSEPFKKR